MLRNLVRAKIQRLTVTNKDLKYEGSLALDAGLLRQSGILPAEVVQVVNVNSGARFETYAIEAPVGSGDCVLNGGAARLGEVGDELIVMSFCLLDEAEARSHRLRVIRVDRKNRIKRDRHHPRRG
jgi:aspartate 1-decarboxylase